MEIVIKYMDFFKLFFALLEFFYKIFFSSLPIKNIFLHIFPQDFPDRNFKNIYVFTTIKNSGFV